MFFSFLSSYAECLPMSLFSRVIPSLDDKGGYKVFSIGSSLYYVIDSEIVQSPIPTCSELSGGKHFIGNGNLYNVTGSTTYQATDEYAFLASSVSFSRYYRYNCSANQFLNLKTKQCESCPKDHIFNQETGKCEPDKRPDWCPEPMIYNEIKLDSLFGTKTVEECVPDPKIDQSNCEKMGLRYHDGCHDSYGLVETAFCMSFPVGCWSPKTVNKVLSDKSLDLGLFVFGSASLPIKSLKNGLGSLSKFFMDLFSSGPKPPKINLLEYKPEIVDIKATKSGPEPVFDFKPVTDEAVILNDTFRKTGKVDPALSTSPDIVRSPQKLADFSPNLKSLIFLRMLLLLMLRIILLLLQS